MSDTDSPRIVVTGGRDYADRSRVFWVLDLLRPCRVAQGECRTGADALAREWCLSRGVSRMSYPANWYPFPAQPTRLDRGAGPKRNTKMLADERPDIVVAFPGGRGTADCSGKGDALGIMVMRIS